MTQPPPDRAPEEQVSAAFVLPLRAFQPDVDSGFWYVHDANGMEVATCYCDSSGARARAIVAAVNGAAALRARGVADEAARKVAGLLRPWWDIYRSGPGGTQRMRDMLNDARGFASLRLDLNDALSAFDAATRAGNETNKAGEGSASGNAAGARQGVEAPSPATSTAGATAEDPMEGMTMPEFARAVVRAWHASPDADDVRLAGRIEGAMLRAKAAAEAHAAAAVKRAREECEADKAKHMNAEALAWCSSAAQAGARATAAEAERARLRSELEQAKRERDVARAKLANDRAAQPARQPAAPPVETVFLARELNDWRDAGAPPSVVALAILKLIRAEIARAAVGDGG